MMIEKNKVPYTPTLTEKYSSDFCNGIKQLSLEEKRDFSKIPQKLFKTLIPQKLFELVENPENLDIAYENTPFGYHFLIFEKHSSHPDLCGKKFFQEYIEIRKQFLEIFSNPKLFNDLPPAEQKQIKTLNKRDHELEKQMTPKHMKEELENSKKTGNQAGFLQMTYPAKKIDLDIPFDSQVLILVEIQISNWNGIDCAHINEYADRESMRGKGIGTDFYNNHLYPALKMLGFQCVTGGHSKKRVAEFFCTQGNRYTQQNLLPNSPIFSLVEEERGTEKENNYRIGTVYFLDKNLEEQSVPKDYIQESNYSFLES